MPLPAYLFSTHLPQKKLSETFLEKEATADISGNMYFSYGIQRNKNTEKTTDSRTIGWNSINIALWLILNASSKPTCLLSFKAKFYKESFKTQLDDWATWPI